MLTYSYIQMAPTLICQQERKVPHQRSVCTVGTQTETTTQDQLQVKSVTPSTGAATQNILQTFIDQLIKEKKCFGKKPVIKLTAEGKQGNGQRKISVRENTSNLEILPKHRENTGN